MYGTSSSDEKLARVRDLGLQHGINYKQRDYEEAIQDLTQGEGVDAVFEMLGGEHTNKSVRCLRDFGRVIVYGSATGQKSELDTRLLYAKGASVHGLWLTYLSANRGVMNQAWKQLAEWTSQGHLHPVIGHVLPMERAVEAYRLLAEGKNFGKVVLKIGLIPSWAQRPSARPAEQSRARVCSLPNAANPLANTCWRLASELHTCNQLHFFFAFGNARAIVTSDAVEHV